jgi:hypothetical protein
MAIFSKRLNTIIKIKSVIKRMMNTVKKLMACLVMSLAISAASQAQPTITGPTCVTPGITYQYLISGHWDSASTMQVCAAGGAFNGLSDSCTANGAPVSFVLVVWKDSITGGMLSLSSSAGNSSLTVNITQLLHSGFIASASKSQAIAYSSQPATLYCAAATGGSCSPAYTYQWLQSSDGLNWTNVDGAVSQNLVFSSELRQTLFFRRKTTEMVTGSIDYSDMATVSVGPPPPGTIVGADSSANLTTINPKSL